jgi:hypothetical protein
MGYFPNGSAGDFFEGEWCSRCVHRGPDGTGCPVMLAHTLFSYELCNEKEHPGKVILDILIPHDTSTCEMFVEGSPGRLPKKGRRVAKKQLPLVGQ